MSGIGAPGAAVRLGAILTAPDRSEIGPAVWQYCPGDGCEGGEFRPRVTG